MKSNVKDATQIGLMSLLILVLFFVLPRPVAYKGPSADILPLMDYIIVSGGIAGIFYSFYLFLKER